MVKGLLWQIQQKRLLRSGKYAPKGFSIAAIPAMLLSSIIFVPPAQSAAPLPIYLQPFGTKFAIGEMPLTLQDENSAGQLMASTATTMAMEPTFKLPFWPFSPMESLWPMAVIP
jgi:hypothetical protein